MAKIERHLKGDFDAVLLDIHDAIINGSVSATLEDSSYFVTKGARCAVKVFERYSALGGNRVSLTISLMQGSGGPIYASAITSGGSQGIFLKLNTAGEEAFLTCAEAAFEKWLVDEPRHTYD